MKKLICVVLMAVFSLSAFAAGTAGKANMTLSNSAQLAGKQLPAGDYKLTWTGEGNDVKVTVVNAYKKEVVTAAAKVVERPQAAPNNAVIKGDDGNIKQVWFSGKKTAIVFE